MTKFRGKDYDQLSEGTKKRLASTLEKVHKSGYSISDYEKMDNKDFASNLGIKPTKTNIEANRRLLRQVKGTSERKQKTIDKSIDQYKKEGWKGKGLERIRTDLVKTAGFTFFEVYDKVQDKYKFETKEQGYEYTRGLLRVPAEAVDDLSDFDKEVIEGYDTSP